jgi:DNA-binding transcriptional ArsR family regulator
MLGDDSLETTVSSKGRLRILKLLSQVEELNISEIARRTNLPYVSADQHLSILQKMGLVEEKVFGRIRIFKFKNESKRCQAVKKFIEDWYST